MKKATFIFAMVLLSLSAAAQDPDSTSVAMVEKLDFDTPDFFVSDYFESIKLHLSREWRKTWKPEFSLRINMEIFHGSYDLTAGIRTSPNKVFGLGVGTGKAFLDANPAHVYYYQFYLYHRHYFPLDRRSRISLYSDLMLGGLYNYKATGYFDENHPAPDTGLFWYYSWQPGISIRLWGKSNLFVGPSIGPTIGAHIGIAL